MSREQLQSLTAKAVAESDTLNIALEKVSELLEKANIDATERGNWIQGVKEAFLE